MKLLLMHFNLKDSNMAYYMSHIPIGASLVAQSVKNLPAVQETQVWSLGWEDPLEKGMATHSRILAWRISMDRGAWQATVHVVASVRHNLETKPPPYSHYIWVVKAKKWDLSLKDEKVYEEGTRKRHLLSSHYLPDLRGATCTHMMPFNHPETLPLGVALFHRWRDRGSERKRPAKFMQQDSGSLTHLILSQGPREPEDHMAGPPLLRSEWGQGKGRR